MKIYPIREVGPENRRAVVIGEGKVVARIAQALLEAGASVTAIGPQFCNESSCLAGSDAKPEMVRRPFPVGDLAGAFLVVAASVDPPVNRAVGGEGLQQGATPRQKVVVGTLENIVERLMDIQPPESRS